MTAGAEDECRRYLIRIHFRTLCQREISTIFAHPQNQTIFARTNFGAPRVKANKNRLKHT